MLESLALGFSTALTVANLGYAAAGVLFGTLVGVLPGLGPVATIAMLLPFTYALEPASAVIMLAGIYYGAQYGGSTTAILLNLPGEASAVVTCLDGHRLARAGRAATALSTAAAASFLGGTLATAARKRSWLVVALIQNPCMSRARLFLVSSASAFDCIRLIFALLTDVFVSRQSNTGTLTVTPIVAPRLPFIWPAHAWPAPVTVLVPMPPVMPMVGMRPAASDVEAYVGAVYAEHFCQF